MEVVLQKGGNKSVYVCARKSRCQFFFHLFSLVFKPTLHVLFIVVNIIIIIGQNGTTIFVQCTIPFFSPFPIQYSVCGLTLKLVVVAAFESERKKCFIAFSLNSHQFDTISLVPIDLCLGFACLPACLPGVILSHLCCSRLQSVATFAVADADAANKEAEFFLTGWQIEKKRLLC